MEGGEWNHVRGVNGRFLLVDEGEGDLERVLTVARDMRVASLLSDSVSESSLVDSEADPDNESSRATRVINILPSADQQVTYLLKVEQICSLPQRPSHSASA